MPQLSIEYPPLTCVEECIGGCGEVWCGCPPWRWGLWELWWWLCPCGWWCPPCPGPWLWWWWPWCWYACGGACRCWCGCECMWWWPPCSCRADIISIMWPMEFMLPLVMALGWCASAAFSLWVDKIKRRFYECVHRLLLRTSTSTLPKCVNVLSGKWGMAPHINPSL